MNKPSKHCRLQFVPNPEYFYARHAKHRGEIILGKNALLFTIEEGAEKVKQLYSKGFIFQMVKVVGEVKLSGWAITPSLEIQPLTQEKLKDLGINWFLHFNEAKAHLDNLKKGNP